jgi:hypothetical protein
LGQVRARGWQRSLEGGLGRVGRVGGSLLAQTRPIQRGWGRRTAQPPAALQLGRLGVALSLVLSLSLVLTLSLGLAEAAVQVANRLGRAWFASA